MVFWKIDRKCFKKVSKKYNLEITGQINAKTWEKLNAYVSEKNNSRSIKNSEKSSNISSNTSIKKQETKQDTQDRNIYLDDNSNTSYTDNPNTQVKQPTTSSDTFLNNSYLDNVLGKYSSLLSPSSYFNNTNSQTQPQPIPTQNYSPYSYSQPSYTQPQINPYSNQFGNSGMSDNIFGKYFGTNTPLQQYLQNIQTPATSGSETNAGKISGNRGDIGQCQATMFAHATLAQGCKADSGDQQNNQKSASGVILSRTGVPAIPAVALPSGGSMGDAVEVKIIKTGQCKAFPLLDRGPAARIVAAGKCIDLTGSAIDILKGRTPCKTVAGLGGGTDDGDQVQYAIIPGEKIKPGEVKDCTHLIK